MQGHLNITLELLLRFLPNEGPLRRAPCPVATEFPLGGATHSESEAVLSIPVSVAALFTIANT